MKITRHSLISAAAVLATAALSLTPAMAATKVNVPFSFVASGKSFPAGVYTVDRGSLRDTLRMQDSTGNTLTWIGLPADINPTGSMASATNRTVLKFDVVGEKYLLRTVQYGSAITSRLDKKARELEAAKERTLVAGQ
jgi:hypothetical protein